MVVAHSHAPLPCIGLCVACRRRLSRQGHGVLAQAAAVRAWQAGVRRQRVELLLPLIGATDLDDWPGGVRQQFKAVLPMCVSVLDDNPPVGR